MNRAGVGCVGLTARGRRCQNTTTNPTGICGRCSGTAAVTALLVQSAATPTPTAGTDPLADPTPPRSWRIPRDRRELERVAVDTDTDPAALDVIARTVAVSDTMPQVWVAQNPSTDPATLRYLADSERVETKEALGHHHSWVDCAIAEHPATPPDLLAHLARTGGPSGSRQARTRTAKHPSAPDEVFATLAESGTPELVAAAARRTRDPDLLNTLAADGAATTRSQVALNPRTPTPTLVALTADEFLDVRRALAERTPLEPQLAGILAADTDPWTQYALADNTTAPADVLAALASSSDPDIRHRAQRNPATPDYGKAAAGLLND